jgi:hypothetical protein
MCAVIAFDIGVKNLAYCILKGGTVVALENVNLLPEVQPILCEEESKTPHQAKYSTPAGSYCKRHLPKTHAILEELDKKKPPPHRRLKELVREHRLEAEATGTSAQAYLAALHTRFALPVQQPKQDAVSTLSLTTIHDALRAFVEQRAPLFTGDIAHVLLENQPAFKNPQMKSVQVLLFATLREWFLRQDPLHVPAFHLVHAKKKVGDAPKGDAGYAERKQKSEDRLRALFESGQVTGPAHYEQWKKAKKKSDMADALCMTVDFSEDENKHPKK